MHQSVVKQILSNYNITSSSKLLNFLNVSEQKVNVFQPTHGSNLTRDESSLNTVFY